MYGLLLESVMKFGQCEYGEEIWDRILDHAGCKTTVFSTHLQYDDNILLTLANSCASVLGTGDKEDHLMFFGRCFVRYFSNYGYDKLIRVTGRHFCEFLSEVDNLHSQMRFSFPRMRSPSMVLRDVDENGAYLQYRSNRFGFTHYLVGQLLQIARDLYDMTLFVSVREEIIKENSVAVTFRLDFDNREFLQDQIAKRTEIQRAVLPQITLQKLLQFFPFGIIIDTDMRIVLVGEQLLLMVGKHLIGSRLIDHFIVQKPHIDHLTWEALSTYQQVTWELESKVVPEANGTSCNTTNSSSSTGSSSSDSSSSDGKPQSNSPAHRLNRVELLRRGSSQAVWALESDLPVFRALILKGQLYFLTECNLALFLCMPLINQLKEMREMGLYLNDLSMHDQSRELALSEFQHCSRLQIMYTRAEEYSGKLEDSLNLQEEWKAKGDDLLYSMLPRQVADLLRQGNDPLDTCRTFAEVSVMFAEATITNEGDISNALDVVRSVNDMYSLLDNITDQYSVFKVETVGGVYMVVGGAPIYHLDHVAEVAGLALHMVKAVTSEVPRAYNIRIGIHVGPVVAGVVGLKLPRYCLFGDTVNTAARMQTNSLEDRIHISEMCARQLKGFDFITTHRGKLHIKGKGPMDTFWLDGRK